MNWREWSKSEAKYGRKLLASGVAGVRNGGEKFLTGKALGPLLSHSAQTAIRPAVVGAFLGLLGSYSANRNRSYGRSFAFGLLGGVIGLSAGIAWQNRGVTRSAVSGALSNISRARDEHWLELHPIDYA